MTNLPPPAAKLSPAIRLGEATLRRKLARFPKRMNPAWDDVKRAYLDTHNVLPDLERADQLGQVNRRLADTHGGGWQRTPKAPVILRAVQDYQEKRGRSNHPLRKKSWARLKHVPLVGDDYARAMKVLKARGINPKNVENALLYCHDHGGYSLHYTLRVPKIIPDDAKRMSKKYHKGKLKDLAFCSTPTGMSVVITQANGKREQFLKITPEQLVTPGFLQDLYRYVVAPEANTVSMDETFVPQLSGKLRDANSRLRRMLRAGAAVDAIRFAVVSPVKREIDDALVYAKKVGVSRNTLRLMKTMSVEKCLCGAPIELRLNPVTLIPVLRRTKCVECGALMDTGHILATRASAYLLDNWRTYGNAGVPKRI